MTEPNTRGKTKDNGTDGNSETNNDNGSKSSDQPSLASRIQSSATNLARSAFQPPTSTELSQSLAASTGNKAGQSSLQPTPNTHSASRDIATQGSGSGVGAGSTATRTQAPAFRNETHQQGGVELPPLTETDFEEALRLEQGLDQESGYDQTQDPNTDLQSTQGPWKGKQRARDPTQTQYETAWQRNFPATTQYQSTPYTPDPNDGSEVLSLLTDPSFDPNMETDPATLPETHPSLDRYAAPAPLSAGEIEAIESFRRDVSGGMREEVDRGVQAEMAMQKGESGNGNISGTSLIPDIDTFLMENDHGVGSGVRTNSGSSLRDTIATYLPGATDWMDVQERYVDDVWGYLEPVLEAAKEEIEDERVEGRGHEDGDGPAVRRLKMILGHMKG
ncbi:hypothetical protein PENANT_c003G01530 [Penicillium antarcticum]|uniref:Uncharacterized protein n=1 Tax=Penicillium antarcticum TaxID=416450 RepID=A0A1V6QHE2_9EURO|nr:uncharacterized protein N7508_005845 [Penicillium antarcticum]KAJ5306830.1 hypothetical protein N7508_005845 [Penicillium antarcticum]OQD88640.1 hypothetical protein PENANT_c003G01530 [Penicillium antarcticum]